MMQSIFPDEQEPIDGWEKIKPKEAEETWDDLNEHIPQVPPPWIVKDNWMEHCKVRWLRKMWRGLSQEAVKYGIMLKEEYDENGLIRITENIRPIYAKLESMWNPNNVPLWVQWRQEPREGKLLWDIMSNIDIDIREDDTNSSEQNAGLGENEPEWLVVDANTSRSDPTTLIETAKLFAKEVPKNLPSIEEARSFVSTHITSRLPEVDVEAWKTRLLGNSSD